MCLQYILRKLKMLDLLQFILYDSEQSFYISPH